MPTSSTCHAALLIFLWLYPHTDWLYMHLCDEQWPFPHKTLQTYELFRDTWSLFALNCYCSNYDASPIHELHLYQLCLASPTLQTFKSEEQRSNRHVSLLIGLKHVSVMVYSFPSKKSAWPCKLFWYCSSTEILPAITGIYRLPPDNK